MLNKLLSVAVVVLVFACTQEVYAHERADSVRFEFYLTSEKEIIRVAHKKTPVGNRSSITRFSIKEIDFDRQTWTATVKGPEADDRIILQFGGPKVRSCPSGWEKRGSISYWGRTLESLACEGNPHVSVSVLGHPIGTWEVRSKQ